MCCFPSFRLVLQLTGSACFSWPKHNVWLILELNILCVPLPFRRKPLSLCFAMQIGFTHRANTSTKRFKSKLKLKAYKNKYVKMRNNNFFLSAFLFYLFSFCLRKTNTWLGSDCDSVVIKCLKRVLFVSLAIYFMNQFILEYDRTCTKITYANTVNTYV